MILVKVAQVSYSEVMGFVVLLRSTVDERSLPILIGAPEAQAIAVALDKLQMPRPLTHDLFKNALDALGARLNRIEVCDLRENTFYAKLLIEREGKEMAVDARPSDAVALALRCGAPVYVAEQVMAGAGVVLEEAKSGSSEKGKPPAASGSKEEAIEALKAQIEKAIQDERYEDAAVLRDKINKLTRHN